MKKIEKKHKLRNLTGKIFKTVEPQISKSYNYPDNISTKVFTARVQTASDIPTKPENLILESIRSRNLPNPDDQIPLNRVSRVIKNYVIPLFTDKIKAENRVKRKAQLGLRNKSVDTENNTFLSELLLSDHLRQDNEVLLVKVKNFDYQLNLLLNENLIIQNELNRVKNDLFEAQILNKFFQENCKQLESQLHYCENKAWVGKNKTGYKRAWNEMAVKNKELSHKLHSERLENDIRFEPEFFLNPNK